MERLHLPTIRCTLPLRVTAVNNQPIRKGYLTHQTPPLKLQIGLFHLERLTFFIISSPANPIILGLLWLRLYDLRISWKEGELTHWSSRCIQNCFNNPMPQSCCITFIERPGITTQISLPKEYHDLSEVISKEKATHLPPHQPWDCAIELLPNSMPPKCCVYPLSLPECQAKEEYIEEALDSLAVAGFFFERRMVDFAPALITGASMPSQLSIHTHYP